MSELISINSSINIVDEFLSLSNFQSAWEKVADTQCSAGIDRETIADFARDQITNIFQLRNAVVNSTYQPLPYKQILILTSHVKRREFQVSTVRDRIVQQALINVLSPVMENFFSPVSFADRPNLSYINAVEQVAHWRDLGYHWVLDADIAQFFDNLDRQRLLKEIRHYVDNPGILCLIKSWISVGVLTEAGLIKTAKGIPQDAVISPLITNIYLNEFD